MLDQKVKLITFFIWLQGALENIFKAESLTFWGNEKKLVIAKLSVKHKVK